MGAQFLADYLKPKNLWLSNPTWGAHPLIWERAGYTINQKWYVYYNFNDDSFDFDGMVKCLQAESSPGNVVILHAAAHNPTGLGPTKDQWKVIADLCVQLQLFPLFDSA
ncbi:hypothetical protein BP5796_12292 [Coleophoma crateriformis]|uniref:Aminotransferase class I/classII large domain-containing protein n=1 Tax=Coleophoma crateriformis TaxID=565419 RepID=A0A3D8Q949_9HELO|nr:hypothetical protein BP5796_12292 [Coleophoma crateriformis]